MMFAGYAGDPEGLAFQIAVRSDGERLIGLVTGLTAAPLRACCCGRHRPALRPVPDDSAEAA